MGIDYARATLAFAVRSIADDEPESLCNLIDKMLEHEENEIKTPFDFMGWSYMNWDGAYRDDPNHLTDSGKHNNHPLSWRLTKGDMQVWIVEEGHSDYEPFFSAGANTKEELQAFLQDIGRPDMPLLERYVFHLIW